MRRTPTGGRARSADNQRARLLSSADRPCRESSADRTEDSTLLTTVRGQRRTRTGKHRSGRDDNQRSLRLVPLLLLLLLLASSSFVRNLSRPIVQQTHNVNALFESFSSSVVFLRQPPCIRHPGSSRSTRVILSSIVISSMFDLESKRLICMLLRSGEPSVVPIGAAKD